VGLADRAYNCMGIRLDMDRGQRLEKIARVFSFVSFITVLRSSLWNALVNPLEPQEEHQLG